MEKTNILIMFFIALLIIKIVLSVFFNNSIILVKVKNFILLVPTMIHEVCHLLGSRLTGGKPEKLILNKDLSGKAYFRGTKFSNFIAILVGYPGTSLFALATTYIYLNYDVYITLWIFISFSIIATIYMRSFFTLLWVVLFDLLLGALLYYEVESVIIVLMGLFIAACIMEALASSFTLFRINIYSFKTKEEVGDATFLKEITKIPAIFWSTSFLVFSFILFLRTVELIFSS